PGLRVRLATTLRILHRKQLPWISTSPSPARASSSTCSGPATARRRCSPPFRRFELQLLLLPRLSRGFVPRLLVSLWERHFFCSFPPPTEPAFAPGARLE